VDHKLLAKLYSLADRYFLRGLKEEIECILPNKVYKGNLLKVARIAENYSHFEKFSEILNEACVEYIRENIDNFFDICASDVPDGETSVSSIILSVLIRGMVEWEVLGGAVPGSFTCVSLWSGVVECCGVLLSVVECC